MGWWIVFHAVGGARATAACCQFFTLVDAPMDKYRLCVVIHGLMDNNDYLHR